MVLLMVGPTGVPILQITAWVGMIPAYTLSTGSFIEAVKETFDGEHPCSLCIVVQELNESEQEHSSVPPKQTFKSEFELKDLPVQNFMPTPDLVTIDHDSIRLIYRQILHDQWLGEATTPPPKVRVSSTSIT